MKRKRISTGGQRSICARIKILMMVKCSCKVCFNQCKNFKYTIWNQLLKSVEMYLKRTLVVSNRCKRGRGVIRDRRVSAIIKQKINKKMIRRPIVYGLKRCHRQTNKKQSWNWQK